jgi:signal peptidase I
VPVVWLVAISLSVVLGGCGSGSHASPARSPFAALKAYRIPSEAMEPTLAPNDHVLVDRTGAVGIHVGDIVVFHPPRGAETGSCGVTPRRGEMCAQPEPGRSAVSFVKRIVAGPGDTVALRRGHVIRNGMGVPEPFIRECGSSEECTFSKPIRVPANHWFLLGDNRGASDDSRFWGPVPGEWIVGRFVKKLPRGAQG